MIIYSTTLNTQAKVKAIYGGTTWTQITDRFILAASSSYAAKSTRGTTTHNHTTGDHTLTTAEIPAHTHGQAGSDGGFAIRSTAGGITIDTVWGSCYNNGSGSNTSGIAMHSNSYAMRKFGFHIAHTHDSVGEGKSHNHGNTNSANTFPSYYAVYIWERTA